MVKTTNFKILSVDTNIVIGLAVLYLRGEKEFIDINLASGGSKHAIKQYAEDLKFLQHCIDKHKILVIITPQVMYELNYRKQELDHDGNPVELSKEDIVHHNLKNLSLEYLERMQKVKIVKISAKDRPEFKDRVERLMKAYDNRHIFERNLKGYSPSDARIFAQTSILGVDFISRDNHFNYLHPHSKCSKAEKLSKTNNKQGYKTKVIALCDLESTMSNIGSRGGLVAKKHFEAPKSAVEYSLLSYAEYLNDRQLGR